MRELRPENATYRIERLVGEGLTASVYKAVRVDSREHSRRTVALKVLKDQTTIPYLRREFETLVRVRSPHCVQVLAWENLPQGSALVLEWIDGVTLLELARSERLESPVVDEIISQIRSGLDALSEVGLHHGDLNPKNVLIDREGVVRIVDFASLPPEGGWIHGTPAYLAPEIWKGDATSLSSDLFALGLIELDLRTGFCHVPASHEAARARATHLMLEERDFFCSKPEKRAIHGTLPSTAELKQILARLVSNCLLARSSDQTETAQLQMPPLEGESVNSAVCSSVGSSAKSVVTSGVRSSGQKEFSNLRKRTSSFMSLVSIALSFAAPVQAEAPSKLNTNSVQELSQMRTELMVRSHYWMDIQVNGTRVGYAPLDLKGLEPGRHRISWRTAIARGEAFVTLKSGQKLLIDERTLTGRAQPRNR